MGLIKAINNSLSGTLRDQWKEIIVPDAFDEKTILVPGILKTTKRGSGENTKGTEGIISNGSVIYVPENTAAFVFDSMGIEEIVYESGNYIYENGQNSVFNKDGIAKSIFNQAKERIGFGGIPSGNKRIAYLNLREIRNIKFGTRGPQVYNDLYYGVDLEVQAYGVFSICVSDPERVIRNFIPANVSYYSFSDQPTKAQICGEFIQSFIVALNSLSKEYRISELPSQANRIKEAIENDSKNVGSWDNRFGLKLVSLAIENIEYSDESKGMVKDFVSTKMNLKAYSDNPEKASNIIAQQKIAEGVKEHGFGDAAGMAFGINYVNNLNGNVQQKNGSLSLDEQINNVKKLKDLLDAGILSQDEFEQKKKEVMGLWYVG